MTQSEQQTALESLQTADALRLIIVQVDRLDRAGHPAVHGTAEAAIVHCNGPAVADALETLAQRLSVLP